jgi:hypothetical protein
LRPMARAGAAEVSVQGLLLRARDEIRTPGIWSRPWTGDANCPGCESIENEQYPRPHKHFGTSYLGSVHAERFVNEMKTVRTCDTCFANPLVPDNLQVTESGGV